jgi:hypothetical protein
MAQFYRNHIIASTHEFKNNIARFTRLLQDEDYTALFVKRRDKVVGIYMTTDVEHVERDFTNKAHSAGQQPLTSHELNLLRTK